MSIAAGFRYLHVGQIDAEGYFVGGLVIPEAGDPPEPMLRLEGAQTAPLTPSEDEIVTVLGDDQPLVTFGFESATLPNGVIEMAARSPEFEALAQGTLVQTVMGHKLSVLQPKGGHQATLFLLAQRRAKSWEAGDRGNPKWETLVVLGTQIRPLFAQIQQRAHTPYRYYVTASKASLKPWGEEFTVEENGADAAPMFTMDGDYPIMLEVAFGDGVEDEFPLQSLPAVDFTNIQVYVEGELQVHTTDWTVAISYGVATITFEDPPADGEHIEFVIEIDEAILEGIA